MAGGKSDYLENELLDHLFSASSYAAPGTLYLALYSVTPTDAGGGTELSGGNYSRIAITNDATNFPAAAAGLKVNGTLLTGPTASSDWAAAVAFGIHDAASGGNLLWWGPLSASLTIATGEAPSFAPGALRLTED